MGIFFGSKLANCTLDEFAKQSYHWFIFKGIFSSRILYRYRVEKINNIETLISYKLGGYTLKDRDLKWMHWYRPTLHIPSFSLCRLVKLLKSIENQFSVTTDQRRPSFSSAETCRMNFSELLLCQWSECSRV